jgi:cardiolipin synthase
VDGVFSTLGSANMDQRSFRLNFEANIFFYGVEVASELELGFLSLCSGASEVTAVNRQGISQRQRLAEGVGRVLAPLL